jgi:hypothetical protein
MAYFNPTTRDDIETALDAGGLYVAMGNGRWWPLRRNGATKLWKKDAARFRIPVKAGLRTYAAITETYPLSALRIAHSREAAEGRV